MAESRARQTAQVAKRYPVTLFFLGGAMIDSTSIITTFRRKNFKKKDETWQFLSKRKRFFFFWKRKKLPIKYFMGFAGFIERKVVKNLEKALLFF